MSDPSYGITFRTIQEAMPEYHIPADLVCGILTAMPPTDRPGPRGVA